MASSLVEVDIYIYIYSSFVFLTIEHTHTHVWIIVIIWPLNSIWSIFSQSFNLSFCLVVECQSIQLDDMDQIRSDRIRSNLRPLKSRFHSRHCLLREREARVTSHSICGGWTWSLEMILELLAVAGNWIGTNSAFATTSTTCTQMWLTSRWWATLFALAQHLQAAAHRTATTQKPLVSGFYLSVFSPFYARIYHYQVMLLDWQALKKVNWRRCPNFKRNNKYTTFWQKVVK